ncbi:MAG: permease [FCB group bacterium]|nr:permease [FCB group bacterium]
MNWKTELKILAGFSIVFLLAFFLPIETHRFSSAVLESLALVKWYAREHVLLCLIPAFFIAGVISVFVSQAAVIKYFGAATNKWISYLVASVSGTILAVCSCTILPLFSGIYKRGAGIGPAVAFLYSGPAINILAIILTARILGFEIGLARIIGAVVFSVVIGLVMSFIYRREEQEKIAAQLTMPVSEESRPLWQTAFHFFTLVLILIFVNFGKPATEQGLWSLIYHSKWLITAFFGFLLMLSLIFIIKVKTAHVLSIAAAVVVGAVLFPALPVIPFILAVAGISLVLAVTPGEPQDWLNETWGFAKQILPLLAAGVLIAGFLLGTPQGGHGVIPDNWISSMVGGNSLFANLFASLVGAFMYFATLTEVPIIQGLMNNGMGKGPALALLLAGPALSLPNMLVIRGIMGTKKTVVFVALEVVMATVTGMIYGYV